MKKQFILIICGLLLSFTAVHAQKPGFGLRAGINTNEVGNEIKIGPHFGAYYSWVLADNFAIQPELLYSVQASRIPVSNVANTRSLSYINIPLMAKLYVAEGLNLQIGPYFGFLMAAGTDDDADISIKANFTQVDYGLGAGAAYEFPGGFNLGGRYNLGLVDVSKGIDSQGNSLSVDTRYTNQFAQFFIGYTF